MSLLQMSGTGAVLILVILLLRRLAMNRVPKRTFLLLWELALARLLIPFSIPSGWSIYSLAARLKSSPQISAATVWAQAPAWTPQGNIVEPAPVSGAGLSGWTLVWAVGGLLCAVSFTVTYRNCYREFQMSFPVENDFARRWLQEYPLKRKISIRQSDRIASPLTFGVLHPVILMPKRTDWQDEDALQYILEHEFVHIRRFDAVTKLLLAAAVCVHWFNPLVWAMQILANRDLELSCDEAVLRRFGRTARTAYATVLIEMAERRSRPAPFCSNFSKTAIEERITAIMKTRKTTILSLALAAVLVTGTATAFATSAQPETADTVSGTEKQRQAMADKQMGTGSMDTTSEEETLMSYVDPKDGKTYYSFDNGKTFTPLTDAEFEALYPTPDIEWWTYDEYKAWLENEKKELQSLVEEGEKGYTNTDGWFTWTQEKADETIALYEEILQDIQNGVKYSKSVDGSEDVMVSYNPADVVLGTSDPEKSV